MPEPIITGQNMDVTSPMKKRIIEILDKSSHFLSEATKVEVVVKRDAVHEGKEKTIEVEVTAYMPHTILRVEEKGDDFYVIINQVDNVLKRRLSRYNDMKSKWTKEKSWKVKEINRMGEIEDGDDEFSNMPDNADYTPLIVKHKQYSDNSPISIGEAIEKMELIGHNAFLFRNLETGKYTMVYKREDGHYGLVEPKYTES